MTITPEHERRFAMTLWECMEEDYRTSPRNQHNPDPVISPDPLIRCQYCGVHDTALLTCPSCGGPRRWY